MNLFFYLLKRIDSRVRIDPTLIQVSELGSNDSLASIASTTGPTTGRTPITRSSTTTTNMPSYQSYQVADLE